MVHKKRSRRVLAWWVIFYFFVLVFSVIVVHYLSPLDRQVIESNVTVSDRTGFDLTKDRLNFGLVAPGQSVTRSIGVDNPFDRLVKITITAHGPIAQGIIVSKNNFLLQPGEEVGVTFTAVGSQFESYGSYSGEIEITYWRA